LCIFIFILNNLGPCQQVQVCTCFGDWACCSITLDNNGSGQCLASDDKTTFVVTALSNVLESHSYCNWYGYGALTVYGQTTVSAYLAGNSTWFASWNVYGNSNALWVECQ